MNLPEGFEIEEDISPPEGFEIEEPKSVMGFAKKIGENAMDAVDLAKGLPGLAKQFISEPVDTTVSIAKGIPEGLIDEAKRVGIPEMASAATKGLVDPLNLTGLAETGEWDIGGPQKEALSKLGNAFYDKPLTTALDFIPSLGMPGKSVGVTGKVAKAADVAGDAAKVATKSAPVVDDVARAAAPTAPPPINLPEEAAQILKQPPGTHASTPPPATAAAPQSVPMGSTFQETVNNLVEKIPRDVKGPLDEVKHYIEGKYGKAIQTPGAVQNFGRALEQKGRGMRLKEIGGSPGQVRMLRDRFGEGVVNDLADLADKKGVTKGFFNWQTGNEINRLKETSGRTIGSIREIAKTRGASHNVEDLIGKIRAELDPIYTKGTGASQKATYLKALQDIRNSSPDVGSVAEKISDVNRFVKKNKMTQPLGATSDVMNTASRINNELINSKLNPSEVALYKEALKDFSAAKVFDKMYGFTYGRDMAGRSGPASPINFIKDVGGRKIMEKVFSKVGRKMQTTPDSFSNPLSLSSDVLDAIDESLDEIIQQMGKGEIAP